MSRLLLCPPDFYAVRYEINPWMDRGRTVDGDRARAQWNGLRNILLGLGCQLELLPQEEAWPDMVFTANAGLVAGRRFVRANFRYRERAGEAPRFGDWFSSHGFETAELPESVSFEGEGDALFNGDLLFCAHPFRTDLAAHAHLAELLDCCCLSVKLVDPRFYHLDTCFCPLDDGTAVWYPPAFDPASRQKIREHVTDSLEVTEEEALRFGCNAVVLGREVILPSGCPRLCAMLAERGFQTHSTPMDEFMKAGGACKCLVLQIARESTVSP